MKELCIKLELIKELYYDARPNKSQEQYCILPYFTTLLCFTIFHSTIASVHISQRYGIITHYPIFYSTNVSFHIWQLHCMRYIPYFTSPLCHPKFQSTTVLSHISHHHYVIPKFTAPLWHPIFTTTLCYPLFHITTMSWHPIFHSTTVSSHIYSSTILSHISHHQYDIPDFTAPLYHP